MSTVHLLTYYRWNTRRSWRLDGLGRAAGGPQTMRYIFRDVGAWKKYARKDTVLWVVGLSTEGHPTLDARIRIDGVYFKTRSGRRWRGVRGDAPPGRFFGLNDAADAMAQIAFTNRSGRAWRLRPSEPGRSWSAQHGRRLRNALRIAPAGQKVVGQDPSKGAQPLEELARRSLRRSLFVSYKHDDLTDRESRSFLDRLAIELAGKGAAVWLDRVALAGTGGEELPRESDEELDRLLAQGLGQCRVVLGVWRALYGTPSKIDGENWTRREWRGLRRGTKRVALDPQRRYRRRRGLPKPTERVLLPAAPGPSDAAAIAARVVRKCHRHWA